jgi:hypothetical protein
MEEANMQKKKVALIIILTMGAIVIGTVPWLLLIFERTRDVVKWLGTIYFQRWGWLLVLCLAGYALNEIRGWDATSKTLRITIMILLLLLLVLSLIWFLLVIFGYVISTIT